jgi:8-oxo-dGTP diphosphatase
VHGKGLYTGLHGRVWRILLRESEIGSRSFILATSVMEVAFFLLHLVPMFNLRVYGILLGENKEVLVSDEFIRGQYYTKFPGGGLEFGEGTRDCLKREFKEEMDLEVEVGDHLYTTDFFQMSAFNPEHQIISIYYFVRALEPIRAPLREKPFDFDEREMRIYAEKKETETFRFIDRAAFSAESVTLPIDKVVAGLLTAHY